MRAVERLRARRRAPAGRAPARPPTRAQRRQAARARRNRLLLIVSTVVSVAVVVAWFPASDLLHQRQQLAAASAQLHQLDQQNRALAAKAKSLKAPSEVERIARQEYDLVMPGQQAYQVLPPSGSGTGVGLATTRVVPHRTKGSRAAAPLPATSSGGFLTRILDTLEFWR